MAAPTINLTVHQHTTTQPYQSVLVTCGMSRVKVTAASDWTQSSANSNEYYYSGTQFWVDDVFEPRASLSVVEFREGTIGSLPTYGYVWGDNDSLGADTLYIRMPDSLSPDNNEVQIFWNESSSGDTNPDSQCTVEWWFDLEDGDTADAVALWDSNYRYYKDWRAWYLYGLMTGDFDAAPPLVDKAGRVPTASTLSPMRGWQYMACLPAGTFSLKCRVTNASGEQTTATQSITVAADTRTERTVHATNPAADHTTLAAAISAASANNRIRILDGHTENISSTIVFTGSKHGILVTADGDNTFTMTASTAAIASGALHYLTFQGLNFESEVAGAWEACRALRTDGMAMVNCHIGATSDPYYLGAMAGISPDGGSGRSYFGLLLQGCSADLYKNYLIIGSTATHGQLDVRVEGCDLWGDDSLGQDRYVSVTESGIRDTTRHKVQTIAHTRVRQTEKDAIRLTGMDYGYVYSSVWNGAFRLGAATPDTVNNNCRIESCYGYRDQGSVAGGDLTPFNIDVGCREATVVNNLFTESSPSSGFPCISGAGSPGTGTTYYAGLQGNYDILIAHNTLYVTDPANDGFRGSGDDDATYVTGCVFTKNYVLTPSGYSGTAITANGFTATDNETTTGSLSGSLVPSTNPSSVATNDGVYDNFYGQVRASTSYYGALTTLDVPTIANRTPNDNATGVSESSTIALQFDQNMQAGSGIIELRLKSDDSVVDSVNAQDVMVNISDRTQVTLFGAGTLTGIAEYVYVYMPPGAVLALDDGAPFGGFMTNEDWDFTTQTITTAVSAPARGRARRRTR